MLSEKYCHLLPRDRNGRIFFNLDKRHFIPLFNLCRDYSIWNGDELTKPAQTQVPRTLKDEADALHQYTCIDSTGATAGNKQHRRSFSFGSSILSGRLDATAHEAFSILFPKQFTSAKMIFFDSSTADFHESCDGKPNTVCIVENPNGDVYGGYASVPWQSADGHVLDKRAFLFTVSANNVVEIQKHPLKSDAESSVEFSEHFGCIFGDKESSALCVCSFNTAKSHGRSDAFDTSNSSLPMWKSTAYQCCKTKRLEGFQLLEKVECVSAALCIDDCQKSPGECCAQQLTEGKSTMINATDALMRVEDSLNQQEADILQEAKHILCEQCMVARFVGLDTTDIDADATGGDAAPASAGAITEFQPVITEIQSMHALFQSATAPVVETVTIGAGGTRVTTTKDTLRQAPEGSPLANMASDAWGHDLASDGNIYQDVNSELFVAIINHLRLKQLLSGTSNQVAPPIVVYEEQKTALDNLLSFYMLTDLPVRTIKFSA